MAEHANSVYRRISGDIRAKIESGAYAPGTKLPPERRLTELYGVERTTVRRALELLSEEGLIVKKTGLGSFVADAAASAVLTDKVQKKSETMRADKARSAVVVPSASARRALPPQCDVRPDYAAASRVLCEILAGMGHERIAFVGSSAEIFAAFAGENARASFYDAALFRLTESPYDAGYVFDRMWRELRGERPTAVVCSNADEAQGVLDAARRFGVRVPDELTVVAVQTDAKGEVTGCTFDTDAVSEKLTRAFDGTTDTEIPAFLAAVPPVVAEGKTASSARPQTPRGRDMSDYLL